MSTGCFLGQHKDTSPPGKRPAWLHLKAEIVCAYRHWFGEISGAWPQVWGEKFVPSKSPSFFLYRAVAGGPCRKNSILSSCNN